MLVRNIVTTRLHVIVLVCLLVLPMVDIVYIVLTVVVLASGEQSVYHAGITSKLVFVMTCFVCSVYVQGEYLRLDIDLHCSYITNPIV